MLTKGCLYITRERWKHAEKMYSSTCEMAQRAATGRDDRPEHSIALYHGIWIGIPPKDHPYLAPANVSFGQDLFEFIDQIAAERRAIDAARAQASYATGSPGESFEEVARRVRAEGLGDPTIGAEGVEQEALERPHEVGGASRGGKLDALGTACRTIRKHLERVNSLLESNPEIVVTIGDPEGYSRHIDGNHPIVVVRMTIDQ